MKKFVCLLFIVSLTISGCEENVIGDFESPELIFKTKIQSIKRV